MRILVVGSGGREHALVWRLSRGHDPAEKRELHCAPGNPGISRQATCHNVRADDVDGQVRLARELKADLVVVGPEQPLLLGLADRLDEEGIPALGASAAAAEIEGSKAFSKRLMAEAGIPTAPWEVFDDPAAARAYARTLDGRVAVKADGLAAGKGVVLCHGPDESDAAIEQLMEVGALGEAGRRVVVEALLYGEEASFIALVDGDHILPLAGSQDHKHAYDGDHGPNTGGMGAVSPTPLLAGLEARILREVMEPAVAAMAKVGRPFRGVLYAGLVITTDGPRVLEFNARFGDPECQALMMRLKGDLAPVLLATARGDLRGHTLEWDPRPAVCVVVASGGYPGEYQTGHEITGLADVADKEDVMVFHAGTAVDADSRVVNVGGRVLGVTALGADFAAARAAAYEAVRHLHFDDVYWRSDIGEKAVRAAGASPQKKPEVRP